MLHHQLYPGQGYLSFWRCQDGAEVEVILELRAMKHIIRTYRDMIIAAWSC